MPSKKSTLDPKYYGFGVLNSGNKIRGFENLPQIKKKIKKNGEKDAGKKKS